ncbi:MAG: PIG-L family deacetylase, partial [Bacteroidota bacterium]|nr:PIG-L family deacetylase [Bacteroidota bacterium]
MRILTTILFIILIQLFQAQQWNSSRILHEIQKLNTLGNVLYLAAHPDDENTRFISYCANEKKMHTGYLSLTRGDGGQNLIGTEIREELGILRTQELLSARSVDGGEQFFTRANDFGYSKNPRETLQIWDKDKILSDVVWVMRKFRPDIVVCRFPPNSKGGHGHHTTSAILAMEAYEIAGDPKMYPEQLQYVQPWQPKRVVVNTGRWWNDNISEDDEGVVAEDIGGYNNLLGESYLEMAAKSRTMHKSQGFGSTGKRGEYVEYFEHLKGVSAEQSLFEGIDFSWNRIQSSSKLQLKLNELINQFDHDNPANSVRTLLELRSMISKLNDDFWKEKKMTQIDEVLRQCLGLFAEVSTLSSSKTKGDTCSFNIEIINRSTQVVKFRNLEILETDYSKNYNEELPFNQVINIKNKWVISKTTKISQPYWLVNPSNLGGSVVDDQLLIGQPESLPSAHFKLTFEVDEVMISYLRPLIFKWNDPVKGEQKKNWVVTPKVTANLDQDVKIFTPLKKQKVTINLRSHSKNQSGSIELKTPRGWNVTGSNLFQFKLADEEQKIIFEITPESDAETGFAEVYINGRLAKGFNPIAYDHISSQLWFPDAKMKLVSLDLNIPYKKVGYLMGAGDKVGDALLNLGYELDFLDPEKLDEATLSSYDVILTGVRFFNVNEKASQLTPMLLRFVKQGGNLIVQYNTSYRLKTKSFFPYPLKISRDRVTQEDAPVTFLQPDHVVLNQPNKMTKSDFD